MAGMISVATHLQVDIGVLSPGPGQERLVLLVLVFQYIQRAVDDLAGVAGHNDVVDVAALGAFIGVFVDFAVFLDALCRRLFGVCRLLDFLGEDDAGGGLGTDDGDPGRGPGKDEVGADALIEHAVVGARVGLAQDNGDEGDGGVGPGKEQLGAVAQYALPVLLGADHIAGAVAQGDDGDVEEVAEAGEACPFVGGVAVDGARRPHGLVGPDAHRPAVEAGETGDNALGVVL